VWHRRLRVPRRLDSLIGRLGAPGARLRPVDLLATLVARRFLGLGLVRRGHHERHLLAFQQRLSLNLCVFADLRRETDQ
jgi:hypothetical protein